MRALRGLVPAVKRIAAAAACGWVLWTAVPPARADEESRAEPPPFLSLTRRPVSLDRLPTNVSVISGEEIRQTGAHTLDEALDLLPAADVGRTGTLGSFSTLRLRGVPDPAQVQVLVDDRPVGGVSAQAADLSQIPVWAVDRVEIVRGGSAMLYGANTLGGAVHVITKRHGADRPESSIDWDIRSFLTQIYRGEAGGRGKRADGHVSASRYFTNGFQRNGDARNVSVSGNAGYAFENGARFSLDLSRSDHDAGDPRGTLIPIAQWDGNKERVASDPDGRMERDINAGRLQAVFPLGGWGTAQSLFYGSLQDDRVRPREDATPSLDRTRRIAGNDTRFFLPGGLTLGAAYERDRQETRGAAPALHHVTDWGVYAQESLDLGRLSLVPALRLDQHSAFGNVVNPRFAAVLRLTDRWKLSGTAARSFRAPSFDELFPSGALGGNPDLRPETAWTYDLGLGFRPAEKTYINVTGFHTRLRERIAPAATAYENASRAEISGAEVEAEVQAGPFRQRLNYAYQRAVGGAAASGRFVPLRLTPRHIANLQLTWTTARRWSLTSTLQYVHKRFQLDDEQGLVLPSRALWGLRAAKKILGAELYFAADNLLDKRHAEAFGSHPATSAPTFLPQPGRTLRGGLHIRFTD